MTMMWPFRQGPDGTGGDALDPTRRLRCVALNDEWEPFINYHIQSETARLYANIPIQPKSAHLRLVA